MLQSIPGRPHGGDSLSEGGLVLQRHLEGGWRGSAASIVLRPWLPIATSLLSRFYEPDLEEAMAPHSSALAWRIPGTGDPGGLPSMGSHRVGHD